MQQQQQQRVAQLIFQLFLLLQALLLQVLRANGDERWTTRGEA